MAMARRLLLCRCLFSCMAFMWKRTEPISSFFVYSLLFFSFIFCSNIFRRRRRRRRRSRCFTYYKFCFLFRFQCREIFLAIFSGLFAFSRRDPRTFCFLSVCCLYVCVYECMCLCVRASPIAARVRCVLSVSLVLVSPPHRTAQPHRLAHTSRLLDHDSLQRANEDEPNSRETATA